jgi:nucleotide-binding universal stress UspA family protein
MAGDPGEVEADLRLRAEQASEAAASGVLGEPVDIDVEVGDPETVLLDLAREVDVLVLGSRGYGPRPGVLLGGVARRLTAEAACPVIVLAGGARVPLEALVAEEPG